MALCKPAGGMYTVADMDYRLINGHMLTDNEWVWLTKKL